MTDDNYFFSLATPIDRDAAQNISPTSLAFVGDAVQTLYVRARLAATSVQKTTVLHHEAAKVVNAVAQSEEARNLFPQFTDEEAEIYRRARNAKMLNSAKNADIGQYRRASGLEAVLGYLYLVGDSDRLNKMLSLSFELATGAEAVKIENEEK